MYRISFYISAALSLAAISGLAGQAQSANRLCAARASLNSQLETRHGETRRSVGLQQDSKVIETYANVETGSWTIIITMPTGVACLIAVGENWREDSTALPMPDEAA